MTSTSAATRSRPGRRPDFRDESIVLPKANDNQFRVRRWMRRGLIAASPLPSRLVSNEDFNPVPPTAASAESNSGSTRRARAALEQASGAWPSRLSEDNRRRVASPAPELPCVEGFVSIQPIRPRLESAVDDQHTARGSADYDDVFGCFHHTPPFQSS